MATELTRRDGTGSLAYPLAYCFMANELNQSAYESLFNQLNEIVGAPGLSMEKCHVDFELASANAVKASDK